MGTSIRRAGTAALVVLLTAASLVACNRPPIRPPVTTAPPTTAAPTTTTIPGGPSTTAPPTTPGRYVQDVFPEIETLAKDEVYKTAEQAPGVGVAAKDLRINVYAPKGDTLARRPVFIWQFGGGFVFGDRNQMDTRAQAAARRGFVGVTIDYRLSTAPSLQVLQNAHQDARDAIAWLTARAGQYRLDPAAVVSGGVSAGAINSLHLITMAPAGAPVPIIGVVSIVGTSYVPARADGPPIIMFSGNQDTTVPYNSQVQFCDAYEARGNVCEQHVYDAGHNIGNTADITAKSNRFVRDLLTAKGY